jgi:hypothetical protein
MILLENMACEGSTLSVERPAKNAIRKGDELDADKKMVWSNSAFRNYGRAVIAALVGMRSAFMPRGLSLPDSGQRKPAIRRRKFR